MENKKEVKRYYTEADINAFAAKFGGRRNLKEIEVESDGDKFIYLVKRPSRAVMQAVEEYGAKKQHKEVSKVIMACVLAGDMEALEHDGAVYNELGSRISEMVKNAKSRVKKL